MLKYLGILVMKTTILFVLILSVVGCAQYLGEVSGYNMYVYSVPDQPAEVSFVDVDSIDLRVGWERGQNETPFVVPGTWTEYYRGWIPNTPEMWQDSSATGEQTISFVEGFYAVTLTEVDIHNNESAKADPFFLQCRRVYARVPINLFRRE